jgi:hypothetical protein
MCLGLSLLAACGTSATDAALIQHFQENKAAYEALKNLLLTDVAVVAVGQSGVQADDSPTPVTPPTPAMPAERYRQYMDLLQKAGGNRVSRSSGSELAVCIGVQADHNRHENVCWHEHSPGRSAFTITAIDSGWYLEGD